MSGNGTHAAFHGFGTSLDPETNLTISLYKPRYSEDYALESFLLGLTRYTCEFTKDCIIQRMIWKVLTSRSAPANLDLYYPDMVNGY